MQQERPSGDARSVEHGLRRDLLSVGVLLVVSVEPFLAFYSRNRNEYVQVGILLQLAVAALVVVAVMYVILRCAFKRVDPLRIAVSLAAFVFCFFRYSIFDQDVYRPASITVGAWGLATLTVVGSVVLWSRRPGVRLFISLYLVISVAILLVSIIADPGSRGTSVRPSAFDPIKISGRAERTPDVWWLIMDQYGRADALEALYGFDNYPFLAELEERGFRVSESSYTSYPVTPLAISSILQMEYAAGDLTSFRAPMRGGGRVVDALRGYDYRYLYADHGIYDWGECDSALVDACIPSVRNGSNIGYLTRTVSELTPLVELITMNRIDVQWAVDQAMSMMGDEPEFTFLHILSPHEPYWFDGDCKFRSRPVLGDFNADSYVHQIGCINPRILGAVDSIKAADPEAIIILQSDHGPATVDMLGAPYEEWTENALADRYSILEAMLMPEDCSTPQGIHSSVSTFEYVLACIEGRAPLPLPDRYFFWRWDDQSNLIEIDRPILRSAS